MCLFSWVIFMSKKGKRKLTHISITAYCSHLDAKINQVGAEFIGTLILIFAGTATAMVNQKTHGSETLLGCAASSGLAVMVVILSTGHISGAHLNPALTIAFAALKHFPWKHVKNFICPFLAIILKSNVIGDCYTILLLRCSNRILIY